MREKVLSRFIFCESIILGWAFSVFCVYLIEEFFVSGTLEPSVRFGLASIFFLCGFGITRCVALFRRKKSYFLESPGASVYEHEMERRRKRKLGGVLLDFMFWIFFIIFYIWRLTNDDSLIPVLWLMTTVVWFLRSCKSLYCDWKCMSKIKVTLYRKMLNVSYPDPNDYFLSKDAAFSFDEIADARIVAAKDPEIWEHVNVGLFGGAAIHTKEKMRHGPYMYALFISKDFPLPDGHQAVDLTLRNGRHVLIETDDAENFIAALRKNGVGAL